MFSQVTTIIHLETEEESNALKARVAELESKELERQADERLHRMFDYQDDLNYFEGKVKKLTKRHKIAKKLAPIPVVISGLIGLALGLILAVSQVLENHGPTVTLWGTIGATAIYLFSGLLFMTLLGWLGKEQAEFIVWNYSRRIETYKKAAQKAEDNVKNSKASAEELAKMAREKKVEVWRYRGLI